MIKSVFKEIAQNLWRLGLVLLALVLLSLQPAQTFALSQEQRRVIDSGSSYFNVEETVCAPTGAPTPSGNKGGTIYVLGDSLTVGMRDAGQMEQKLAAAGWQPTKINAVGGEDLGWGLEQVRADSALITGSASILVGLGTNNVGTVVEGSNEIDGGKDRIKAAMQQIVDEVISYNADIQIYWTNIYITGMLSTQYGEFDMDVAKPILNTAIDELALENGITIIPWGSSSEAQQLVSSDGIHPSGKYPEMATYIVSQLSNAGAVSAQPGNCACKESGTTLTGSDNQQKAFNFFVSKGYKPEWAAGIVGNMIHESGVEPMRLQGTGSGVQTSSADLGGNLNNTNIGWGLVQWTPPGKMVTAALQEVDHDTVNSLEYQLDFVWKQLEGTAIAINEKSAGDRLKQATTAEDAAIAFGRYYERFAGSDDLSNSRYTDRKEAARSVFDIYSGTAPGVGSATGGCGAGVAGANGWDLPGEGPNPMVYYSQRREGTDPAVQGYFGNSSYGPGPISYCGCGPTSWAMIVSTLTGTETTPDQTAAWAHDNGWQQSGDPCGGSGWWWDGGNNASEAQWGVQAVKVNIDEAAAALRSGALIIMSSNARNTGVDSPFTSGGHLLVMRAVTDDGKFLFADPNDHNDTRPVAQAAFGGKSKSRTPLAPEQFMPSTQGLWAVTRIGAQ